MSSPPAQQPQQQSSGVELSTLAIAAVASGVAAYVTSKLWPGGTLISASLSPVIVALVKEGLAKTTDVTTRRVRDLATGKTIEVEVPREDVPEPFDPLAPVTPPPPTEQRDTVSIHRDGARRGKRWKLAVVTGLLAFVVAAVVITVPQLIANSADGGGRGTTYFGGGSKSTQKDEDTKEEDATPTPTPTGEADEEATPTATPETEEATPTATPSATATPTPSATATPSVAPSATATPVP